jgi:hypothetical protein
VASHPTDNELSGMTMNERLYVCGLMDRFDAAIRNYNRREFIDVLTQIAFTEKQASEYYESLLKNLKSR